MTEDLAPAASPSLARELFDMARTVALGLAAALALHAVLFQPFTIPSASMEPGLQVGDYLVVSKFRYGWSWASPSLSVAPGEGRLFGRHPKRGDVVVFRLPRDPRQVWVKRVIGLPGDRVAVRDGRIVLNGQAVPLRRLGSALDGGGRPVEAQLERLSGEAGAHRLYDHGPGLAGDERPEMIVPEGRYLVMGDNRDNSLDGRWSQEEGVGLLPAANLLGRAELIVASWEPGASLFKPWTWVRVRSGRVLKPIR